MDQRDHAAVTSPSSRILLGHLAAFGDCLCATAIARQIKQDYPSCHLTWAIAAPFRQIIEGNPYVDRIWEIPMSRAEAVGQGWRSFVAEAREKQRQGEFDLLFLTQIPPDNFQHFDGTVRASNLNGYPRPITVPLAPVLRLSPDDVQDVREFADRNALSQYRHRVLFEYGALSGQTFVTQPFALETARLLLHRVPDCCFIFSSSDRVTSADPRIMDASILRFRQNAELTRYATLFIGCGSGITWLTTSDWANPLPTVQLLLRKTSIFASLVHDARHFGLPSDHILEMTDCTPAHLADCIHMILTDSFAQAHAAFHEHLRVDHRFYFNTFFFPMVKRGHLHKAFGSLSHVVRRYGLRAIPNTLKATFEEL